MNQQGSLFHPQKFVLWLTLVGSVMLFMGLTSAYIVRMGDGNWYQFSLPNLFLISTFAIVLSSATMFWAYKSAKNDDLAQMNRGLWATLILGVIFIFLQIKGWQEMTASGLTIVNSEGGKISASFVYMLSFVHLAHIVGGLFFILFVINKAKKGLVHKKNTLIISNCHTFWHFIGFVWVYLYLFLYFAPLL
jgi:cytochrome c oxidase subunit 3